MDNFFWFVYYQDMLYNKKGTTLSDSIDLPLRYHFHIALFLKKFIRPYQWKINSTFQFRKRENRRKDEYLCR